MLVINFAEIRIEIEQQHKQNGEIKFTREN